MSPPDQLLARRHPRAQLPHRTYPQQTHSSLQLHAQHLDGLRGALLAARDAVGRLLGTEEAMSLGLVTMDPDDLDWDDEIRIALEERASLSPEMALRVEKAFGVSMDTLMRMQNSYDIAQTRKREGEIRVVRYDGAIEGNGLARDAVV